MPALLCITHNSRSGGPLNAIYYVHRTPPAWSIHLFIVASCAISMVTWPVLLRPVLESVRCVVAAAAAPAARIYLSIPKKHRKSCIRILAYRDARALCVCKLCIAYALCVYKTVVCVFVVCAQANVIPFRHECAMPLHGGWVCMCSHRQRPNIIWLNVTEHSSVLYDEYIYCSIPNGNFRLPTRRVRRGNIANIM